MALVYWFLFLSFSPFQKEKYPTPPAAANRLFYIQHSENHNTYVYDAIIKDKLIDKDNPVDEYRIVYTEGAVKKPLSFIQKKMAYGLTTEYVSKNMFKATLAAFKEMVFYITMNHKGKPIALTTVNNRKLIVDKLFVQLKEGTSGINAKIDHVMISGKDFTTGKVLQEKLIIKN